MRLRKGDLTWQVVGDDVVVLDLGGSVYLKLNGSARLLWEALADVATDSDLRRILIDTYHIDEQRAADDVAVFLCDLRTRDILVD